MYGGGEPLATITIRFFALVLLRFSPSLEALSCITCLQRRCIIVTTAGMDNQTGIYLEIRALPSWEPKHSAICIHAQARRTYKKLWWSFWIRLVKLNVYTFAERRRCLVCLSLISLSWWRQYRIGGRTFFFFLCSSSLASLPRAAWRWQLLCIAT